MEFDICWKYFMENLIKLREKTESLAKRSGITADAAILLTIINDYPKINLPFDKKLYDELISKGLITYKNEYQVTGRGAILAKAFSEIRKNGL